MDALRADNPSTVFDDEHPPTETDRELTTIAAAREVRGYA